MENETNMKGSVGGGNRIAVAVQKIEKVKHESIFSALSAFQGELKPIEKTGSVNFKAKNSDAVIDFKYAPLETV
jgi:hypothetical protein